MKKFFICRFVIESNAPLAIHTGDNEVGRDTQLATDWNNLPYIPATSIVGVWRSIISSDKDLSTNVEYWFGRSDKTSEASKFTITDALLLDQNAELNFGILSPTDISKDSVYKYFSNQHNYINRERTSINSRSVAKGESKFDVAMLPKGLRFSFDVEAIIDSKDEDELKKLIKAFSDHDFTLGSNSSNGFGSFIIKGFKKLIIDMSQIENKYQEIYDFRNLEKTPINVFDDQYINFQVNSDLGTKFEPLVDMELEAEDSWRIGNLNRNNVSGSYKEDYVDWSNGFHIKNQIIIMGSSIKGILRHRTLYHYLKLKNIYAENIFPTTNNFCFDLRRDFKNYNLDGFVDLFGNSSSDETVISKLVVKDVVVKVNQQDRITRTHNKIDVFSGGTMTSALFTEERLYKPKFNLKIFIMKDYQFKDQEIKQALKNTICDIKDGFLPIASGTGRQAAITKCISSKVIFE